MADPAEAAAKAECMLFSGLVKGARPRWRFWCFYNGLQIQTSLNGGSPVRPDMFCAGRGVPDQHQARFG
jgi:hypothetical protein